MITRMLPAVAAIALFVGCTSPDQGGGGQSNPARSSFIEDIYTWQPDGTEGVYIQLDNKKWYYATFQSPCIELPSAMVISFRTQPPLSLDKFDGIVVEGRTCFFKSLDPSRGPKTPDYAVPKPPLPTPQRI
jgi:hypothetical protein